MEVGPGDDDEDPNVHCYRKRLLEFERTGEENKTDLSELCPAMWDSVHCWPFTRPGVTLTRPCAEVVKDSDMNPTQLAGIQGNAIRVCAENSTWLWGNWTNYNECLDSLGDDEDDPTFATSGATNVVEAVRWILFLGSISSFLMLAVSLLIFYYFKCLRCHRVTVHIHFMVALAIRFVLLVIITEPFIFHRTEHYRKVDWVCKTVMCTLMYATVSSTNWMFIQGHYLHSRVTTNIFDTGTPFRIYYIIGWVLPLLLIAIWAIVMDTNHKVHCWKNFPQLGYIWILAGPMIGALTVNLLFLFNIMRILLTKIQRANTSSDAAQFRRAVKATVILFPLLGINNLLFVYNPGGGYENVYLLSNTIIQSSQGIFVSLLYCFFSHDVRDAIRREYRRFSVRRSANSFRRQDSRHANATSVVFLTPKCIRHNGTEGGESARDSLTSSPGTPNSGRHVDAKGKQSWTGSPPQKSPVVKPRPNYQGVTIKFADT